VLPGEYQVRLGVGGQAYTQPLRVELDPRVHVSDSALAGQLRLALEIWNAMAQQVLHGGLRSLERQLRGLGGRTLDGAARGSITALQHVTDSLARAVRNAGDELAGLETAVESADREPTQQARDAFAEVRERLSAADRRWQRVLTSDLPALNTELQRKGVPPLQVPARARESIDRP